MYLQEQIVDGAPIGEQGRYVNHYDTKLQPVDTRDVGNHSTVYHLSNLTGPK